MLYEQAAKVLTVPYLLNGWDIQGWDCRGCVNWARRNWLGLESPNMDGWYPVEQATNPEVVERLIRERMDRWEPCAPKAGAVALFTVATRAAHVAIMLDSHNFLHSRADYNTCVDTLQSKRWLKRLAGVYELR